MTLVEDDLTGSQVGELLRYHLEQMHLNSPEASVFAFDITRLRAHDVSFWTAWDGDALLGCAALRPLDADQGEIKSMRTAPAHLRKGVASTLLSHIVGVARARGYRRLSLETGSGPAFDPAISLYRRCGFVDGGIFGNYRRSAFNRFLHLEL